MQNLESFLKAKGLLRQVHSTDFHSAIGPQVGTFLDFSSFCRTDPRLPSYSLSRATHYLLLIISYRWQDYGTVSALHQQNTFICADRRKPAHQSCCLFGSYSPCTVSG